MLLYGLLVNDKSISDGAVLFFRCVRVGSESRTFGSLDGFLTHGIVENLGAFCGHFGANDLPSAIHPNIDHNLAFFAEVVIGTMQTLGATATEVITCAVAFSTVTIVFLDASQSVGLALVAGLAGNAFRATSLRIVAALEQGLLVDSRLGLFYGFGLLLRLGVFRLFDGGGFVVVLGDDVFLALVLLLLRLGGHRNGGLFRLDVAHALIHHA